MVEWPAPETVKHLRSFLGLANFFRTFIPVYSEMAAPLTELLKNTKGGSQNLEWYVSCQTAFMSLKAALTSGPVLRHFDPTLRTAIHIDGSQNAVGAVLLQWQEGEDNPRPVAYMSRKLKGAQYCYDAQNVEALAAQMILQTWRTLLMGQKFEIYSDHDSLQYLFTQKSPSQRILGCVSFWQILTSRRLNMCPDHTMLFPTFSRARGMAQKWTYCQQFIRWQFVHHVVQKNSGTYACAVCSSHASMARLNRCPRKTSPHWIVVGDHGIPRDLI